ncbi:MAG: alanine--glyoxylate aminotransferase family protein [Anaerolineaceae bacterium]|nr:alanine--glyoxylate aminotransferase family protein [Anaerolineaceae bacterium]MBN2678125.1 alanine--glyoxylate aminotransferase family protein [Anaerolineaceae bacterium]
MSPMFVPGPVDVAPEVLTAQTKPMLPHRSKDFEAIFKSTEERLKKVFFTEQPVYQVSASGSGMQEGGIRNFVQESVLSCINGAFAERWYKVAVANGKQADRLEAAWGQPITPEQVADALKKKHYEAITVVHNETSTGVESPVKAIAEAVHQVSPDTLILVDAVSSLSGVKIEFDAWGLDFILTSSQKCFALPPGMSFAAASARAMAKAETVANRGWYFDLLLMEKHRVKDSTPMTPAMASIFALDVQLERILAEGLENRFARHTAMAERTQKWAVEHGMQPLAPEGYRSKTVSTINNTRGMDISALNKFLLTRGMRIANGYGDLKEKTFRIAHMGEIHMKAVDTLLEAMEEFLAKM